ncbi:hypothetical protein BSF42_31430 [Flavobacterium sp. ACN6]|nr:hypothetical protein BSF42_31430 [Flavobacterium sp. ACN6]
MKRLIFGKEYAREQLDIALSNEVQHNFVNEIDILIKDSTIALQIVEPILFSIYERKNIETQKPYEIYLLDNYWVISGTLEIDSYGGTFLIIIDARNSQIIKITHGR